MNLLWSNYCICYADRKSVVVTGSSRLFNLTPLTSSLILAFFHVSSMVSCISSMLVETFTLDVCGKNVAYTCQFLTYVKSRVASCFGSEMGVLLYI